MRRPDSVTSMISSCAFSSFATSLNESFTLTLIFTTEMVLCLFFSLHFGLLIYWYQTVIKCCNLVTAISRLLYNQLKSDNNYRKWLKTCKFSIARCLLRLKLADGCQPSVYSTSIELLCFQSEYPHWITIWKVLRINSLKSKSSTRERHMTRIYLLA